MTEQIQPLQKGKVYVSEIPVVDGVTNWSACMLPVEGGAVLGAGLTKIEALRNYGQAYRTFREALKAESYQE